jgi:hypothetical protein
MQRFAKIVGLSAAGAGIWAGLGFAWVIVFRLGPIDPMALCYLGCAVSVVGAIAAATQEIVTALQKRPSS